MYLKSRSCKIYTFLLNPQTLGLCIGFHLFSVKFSKWDPDYMNEVSFATAGYLFHTWGTEAEKEQMNDWRSCRPCRAAGMEAGSYFQAQVNTKHRTMMLPQVRANFIYNISNKGDKDISKGWLFLSSPIQTSFARTILWLWTFTVLHCSRGQKCCLPQGYLSRKRNVSQCQGAAYLSPMNHSYTAISSTDVL